MDSATFQSQLSAYKHRRPFAPFTIEMTDGRVYRLDEPGICFHEDGGGILTADDEMVFFDRREVREIRAAVGETAQ